MKRWLVLLCAAASAWAQQTDNKVVVIGFDGADYQIVDQMLAAGELPNLAKLAQMGGFKPLIPTNPPQTPVSWSTFATGVNPGRTGIYDFLKRKPGLYVADLALKGETSKTVLLGERNRIVFPIAGFLLACLALLLAFRKSAAVVKWPLSLAFGGAVGYGLFFVFANWVPVAIPGVETVRKGKPIWTILEEQGKSAAIIRLPITFPAEPLNGEMISGLVVPDMRGTVGRPSIYSNDPEWVVDENKFSVRVTRLEGTGPKFQTEILGPPNKLFYNAEDELKAKRAGVPYGIPKDFTLDLAIERDGEGLTLAIDGARHSLKPKEWTDWIETPFRVNPLIVLRGGARFYLDYLRGDVFKLYMTPVHVHPKTPLPMSYPSDLAKKVWAQEPYKTMGWALDTWCAGSGLMDEDHFLSDVELTVARYERMLEEFLSDNERDLFVQVFSFTDRVGHILWRYWDPEHPRYDPVKGPKYQEAMRDAYRRMDRIVGRAMGMVDMERTVFLVCSDHGFSSWRYQFNFNTWLVKNGYMTLKKNVLGQAMELDDLTNSITPFNYVDWSQTKAYAFGLGMIFINLEGREPEGSVKPEDYDELCRQLAADLEAFVDERTGLKPVRKVYQRDEIYSGYDPEITPDLRVATALNFRVSWDTTLGGMPEALTEINPRNWSGDHCSLDPRDVKGILFSSRPIKADEPQMADLCPSILAVMGVEHDVDMDGRVIF